MATVTRFDLGTDNWVQMPATWELYHGLCRARGDKGRPRYVFVDGIVTAVSPGTPHEILGERLSHMIVDVFEILDIDYLATGSVTLLNSAHDRTGAEADKTYYLANIAHVSRTERLVMGQDPPPDLAVEVVVSHPEHDALEAYRRFGVREVWVVKRSGLAFLALGDDGQYAPSPTSALLPFLTSDELEPWLFRADGAGDLAARREFRAWVEQTLAPRVRPEG